MEVGLGQDTADQALTQENLGGVHRRVRDDAAVRTVGMLLDSQL